MYFLSDDILKLYACDKNIFVNAKQGLATGDNERFVRLFWEVNNRSEKWFPLAKGGDACPFYGNVPTEVNWEKSGNEISNFNAAVIRNKGFYFRPALTWTLRANSLSLRVFPKDGIFDRGGSCVFVEDDSPNHLLSTLALLNSRAFQNLIAAQLQMAVGNSRYECGMLSSTPFPVIKPEDGEVLSQWAKQNFEARRKLDSVNEESRFFLLPEIIQEANEELNRKAELETIRKTQEDIDIKADQLYYIQSNIIEKQEKSRRLPIPDDTEKLDRLISWAVGVAFGRFDWRLAIGERDIPIFGEPFDPYPKLAPGRLPEGDAPLIPNQGIFVMDPSHERYLERAVRTVLHTCFLGDDVDIKSWLKDSFFKFHLKTYSAAARVAPIYWPVGTASGSYILWLYYPKLSQSMLYAALNDFVDPKLALEKRRLEELQHSDGPSPQRRNELTRKASFIAELTVLRTKLQELAETFEVHFDDGVAINAVRFMPIIQSKDWLKKLEKTAKALEKGDLDWSETAADLYPERVKEACRKNPSIRLAHRNRGWFTDDGQEIAES